MTKFHDLDFTQSADGTVLLIQTDCGVRALPEGHSVWRTSDGRLLSIRDE